MKKSPLTMILGPVFALAFALSAHAAENTGTIAGRVYNPATREYVRNAEVRIEGTNLVAYTEPDGSFQFGDVAEGPVALSVAYSGYQPVTERFNVATGATVRREIQIVSAVTGARAQDGTIKLQEFVVSTEREGNAKAIMDQRRNMNVTTSVASDVFGDVTDGDVGEFLKYLPGVDLDYQESATKGPKLGGMDGQYVGVTFDGVALASADALRTGDLGRATSFEAISISSVESIEISRTTSPDMDANAPAGTINMKTRRAFERKGRRISYNFGLSMNSEEFQIGRSYGPNSDEKHKARPSYKLEYSDVFLGGKLGIVTSLSRADSYREQFQHNQSLTKSATNVRPVIITSFHLKDGPIAILKDTFTLTADYKATPNLVLSSTVIYNYTETEWYNKAINFRFGTNDTNATTGRDTIRGDGLLAVEATGGGQLSWTQSNARKETTTRTLISKFEYTLGAVTIDGWGSYSGSFNNYEALEDGLSRSEATDPITGGFTATRPDVTSYNWTLRQTSGPDWFDLANYRNPRITNEGRTAQTDIFSGGLNARWKTPLRRFPTVIKFGGKITDEERNNRTETPWHTWSYIGPGGNAVTGVNAATGVLTVNGAGSWTGFEDPNHWNMGRTGLVSLFDLRGAPRGTLPRVNSNQVARHFAAHPEQFAHIGTPANYYSAFVGGMRDVREIITAAYGMADIRLSSKAQVRAGMRWEGTEGIATEFDPKSTREMRAAGYPIDANGQATTFDGIHHQYFSQPRVKWRSEYDEFFPSVSLKYNFWRNLDFHAGYNEAISRAPVDSLTGAWVINDETQIITAPNPNLLPEYSKNYAVRLGYYFNPAGQLSVTVTQNTIRNARITRLGTAEEFGLDDSSEYGGYEFRAPFNVPTATRHRNMEVGYSQSLPFQHELLRGTTVNLSYTRSYASARRNNLLPHRVAGSIGYGYRNLRVRVGAVWRDDTDRGATAAEYGRYRRHDTMVDLSTEYRLNRWMTLYAQGRNIFNVGMTLMDTPPNRVQGDGAFVFNYENYGVLWNFGVKATF